MLVTECCWLALASVPQQEASPFLEAWVRGAESAPRLVAGAGLAPRSRLCVEFLYRWPLVGRRSVRSADECVVRLSPPCTRERDNTCGPASRLQYTRSRRSDETFMTTRARNHGPLSCRDHLKRVAAELASFVATTVRPKRDALRCLRRRRRERSPFDVLRAELSLPFPASAPLSRRCPVYISMTIMRLKCAPRRQLHIPRYKYTTQPPRRGED